MKQNVWFQGVDKILSTSYLNADFMEGILKACIKKMQVIGKLEKTHHSFS